MEIVLKRLQEQQMKILREVKRVCEKNNIPFYLAFGSCLGAIRHQGFIPWDDDIDICMHVEDYERFLKCRDDFGDDFFLQTNESDENYGLMIARVRLNGTTLIEKDEQDLDIHHGIFLDVYPLFGCPKGKIRQKIITVQSILYRLLLLDRPPKNKGSLAATISRLILLVIPKGVKKNLKRYLYRCMKRYTNSDIVATLYGMDISLKHITTYKREWFAEPRLVPFEGELMPVPTDYHAFLTKRYGDYMKLPPKEKQSSYHTFVFVDTEKHYQIYKGKQYCVAEEK